MDLLNISPFSSWSLSSSTSLGGEAMGGVTGRAGDGLLERGDMSFADDFDDVSALSAGLADSLSMATLQMKSLVAALLPEFKFEMASDTEPRYSINMTLAIKNGFQ